MTHYVYIAASGGLLDWSGETHGRAAIKVGESADPTLREIFLSGRNPRSGAYVRPCCGFDDWKIVAETMLASEQDALDLEARFKAAFDPANIDMIGTGESDIVLLPPKRLVGADLERLDAEVRKLYVAAECRMYDAVRAAPTLDEPAVPFGESQVARDQADHERDQRDIWTENQDRAARSREDGFYYED